MRFSIFLALFVVVWCGCGEAPPTIDGYTYKTVKIGDQEWFAENLKTTVYANGDEIPYSRIDQSWATQEMGMRCSYDHDEAHSAKYGQLYNWHAVDDDRGVCPIGWHVPTDKEWQDLEVFFGVPRADVSMKMTRGTNAYGLATKVKARNEWSEGKRGTDDFGFAALPAGFRLSNGEFANLGTNALFWSSTLNEDDNWVSSYDGSGTDIWIRFLDEFESVWRIDGAQRTGYSVRCLRDAE